MVAALLEEDPETAWQHAMAARARGSRLAVVREAAGLAAYRSGRYADALAELRTVRRITGGNEHLPVMADCERGLGRPERALALAASPEAATLPVEQRVELAIVVSGARLDLGQHEAAVLAVQLPELEGGGTEPWRARLRAAYAVALADAGRTDEAEHWTARAGPWTADGDEDDVDLVDLGEDLPEESLGEVEPGSRGERS
jgi:hypothetical protein